MKEKWSFATKINMSLSKSPFNFKQLLHIEIIAEFNGGIKEKFIATMIVKGDPEGEIAMSIAVALPTAISSRLIMKV